MTSHSGATTPGATTPTGYTTVAVPESRKEELLEVDRLAFAMSAPEDGQPEVPDRLDWTRTMGIEQADGALASIHSSYPFVLPVPGSTVPCAGLTWVGVRPDHRRRGLLSAMIVTHFDRSLARGEPVSALFAAEPGIYGRFGYGAAAQHLHLTLPRGASLRDVPGSAELDLRLEPATAELHDELVHSVHRAAGAGRPGWIERTTARLRAAHLADPRSGRDGAEELRIVTVRDDARVRGYALLRRKERWVDDIPQGIVRVVDLAAVDGAAAHRLWTFLLDLDLMASVESPHLAVDDALESLLVDVRGARPRVSDNLWIRLLDVPAALTARRYAAPLDVVVEVADQLLPANAGRWRVRTTDASSGAYSAEVRSTSGPADVALDVRDLGAAYLGGRSLAAIAAAGLAVEHHPGTVAAASTAFGWPLAPVCSWTF